MMKRHLFSAGLIALMMSSATAETVVSLNFGRWVTRNITESKVIGGKTKTIYEIGPTQTINGATPYTNKGGSPWASSNVLAKVMGVVKVSGTVTPEARGGGKCAKLTTSLEHVSAVGIVNMDVLAAGTIFLGSMKEPISSTKNPYRLMNMGSPYSKRPKYLQFDYKLHAPTGDRIYSPGFGSQKTMRGRDYAEVFIILQRRWEDSKGNLHAARVGTGRIRLGATTSGWVNNYRVPVWYGDITSHKGYQSYMGLIPKDRSYYATNSKGKMVPVVEEKWDDANATPTHMLVMASSGCGTPYVGTVGMTLWVDNMSLVF